MSLVVETFRTAPPQRKLALALTGGAVILALLVAVYFLVLRTPYEVLFTDLRPMDAATIVGELDKKKVPYKLADGGATVLVPRDQVASTRIAVMSGDLPLKGMVGFELFNKSDMGLTEFAQKINYQRALQGELARTIMTMDAVDTARVHLSLPEPTVFRADRLPSKASVTIVTRPGKVLTPGAVRGIQRLVAAAAPELDLANVVVLDKRGEVLSGEILPAALVQAPQAIEAPSMTTTAPRPTAAPTWDSQARARKLSGGGLTTFNLVLIAALPILVLLFAAAYWLERRRSEPRRLTVRQRTEYTEKLRTLLDKETADAGA